MPKAQLKEKAAAHSYDATKIQVLEGVEAVRRRPAMYIGDTGVRGLHHLVYEVVDNSVDEAMAGHCTEITVTLHPDNSVSVADNGRGIPVDIHKTEKKPTVEVVLTTLHAGGKFDHRSYKVSGGLHGVGVSVVNALSEWLEVEVRRDGKTYHQRYEAGKTKTKLVVVGKASSTGTQVTFKADREIFSVKIDYAYETLSNRLRELAFLNRGLKISFADERSDKSAVFYYEGGVTSFIEYLNKGKIPPADAATSLLEKVIASRHLIPVVTLIALVLGSIYSGVATATEAAALGVAGSLVLSSVEGTMSWSNFKAGLAAACRVYCMIGLILAGAAFLTLAMGFIGLPRHLAEFIGALHLSPFMLIVMLVGFFIVLGCFLDGISMVVLTMAVLLPTVEKAGFDLIWFGIFIVLVVEMAQITPPVGFNLFVLQGLTKKQMTYLARVALPFFLVMILMVLLTYFVPDLVLWMPRNMS